MDLYLEFRKMVRPLVIDMKEETGEIEDFCSLDMPDEREEVEAEEGRSSFAFAG